MENSAISWTDHTFNPWIGCTKVSAACANCYAERDMDHRFGKAKWGPMGTRVVTSAENWMKPLKWDKISQEIRQDPVFFDTPKSRVFCASLADVFEDWEGPIVDHHGKQVNATMDDLRRELFELIDATTHLDWLLLTKRPENIRKMWLGSIPKLSTAMSKPPGTPEANIWYRPNCWIGTSVENQEQAEKRIPELLKCRDLSPVLFLSCEPLLGVVRLNSINVGDCPRYNCLNGRFSLPGYGTGEQTIDWVIAGGESGPNARPTHPDWFRSIRDQCNAAGVPFHFKQWGEFVSVSEVDGIGEHCQFEDGRTVRRVGVKNAGRILDGRTWDEFPQVTPTWQLIADE